MFKKETLPNLLDIALGLIFVYICLRRFQEYNSLTLSQSADLCWLIRTGDYILKSGAVPHTDLFNWYLPERTVVSYQWLFEIFISVLHSGFGLFGIGLLSSVAAAFFLFWLLPRSWLRMSVPFSVVFLCVALIDSRYWHFPRPQLVCTFFMYALIQLLEKTSSQNRLTPLFFLPPLILLWVNTHPTFVLALVICAIYFVGIGVRTPEFRMPLAFTLVLCLSLVFVNPFGFQLISHTFSFMNGSQYLRLYETLPAYEAPDLVPFLIYSASALLIIALGRKQLRFEQITTTLLSLILGLAVNRFEPFAVVGSWQSIGLVLANLQAVKLKDVNLSRVTLFNKATSFMIPILIGMVIWIAGVANERQAFSLLVTGQPGVLQLPFQRKKERLFNDPIIGSWMIYCQYGKPFVDNRFDTLPNSMVKELSDCLSAEPSWVQYLQGHKFESILIPHNSPLFRALARSSAWICLADDGQISYWERRDGVRAH